MAKQRPNTKSGNYQIELRKISELKLNPKNPRKFSESKLAQLKRSLLAFPEMLHARPLVLNKKGEVLGGNFRLTALRELLKEGQIDDEAPTLQATNFTPAQQKEFAIKDNVSFGEWDFEALAKDGEWDTASVSEWGVDMPAEFKPPAPPKELKTEANEEEVAGRLLANIKTPVPAVGDVWILGRHRLVCGDCRDASVISTLMRHEQADAAITDPPYNVDYKPESRESYFSPERKANPLGTIKNDKMAPDVFHQFLVDVYTSLDKALKPGGSIYIFHADTEGHHFRNAYIQMGWKLAS